jgi:Na+/H+ antiporter NhaD/arsenite permease-like protein
MKAARIFVKTRTMEIVLVALFLSGYLVISTEHVHRIDKMIPALLMMVLAWGLLLMMPFAMEQWLNPSNEVLASLTGNEEARVSLIQATLLHHLGKTAEILMFLIGAMTLVELIDHFDGFKAVLPLIKTRKKYALLWVLCLLAFFLSAIIDNLTTTLVMIAVYRKLVHKEEDRLWYAGFIVISANAGGAWSPIGDVTTTMLWIGQKISIAPLMIETFIPSLLCMMVPLVIARWLPVFKGDLTVPEEKANAKGRTELLLGIGFFLFVPALKAAVHLPPYMGMLFALGLFALYAEWKSNRNFKLTEFNEEQVPASPTMKSLEKVELPTILFFLGILLTVAALESIGIILQLGKSVQEAGISTSIFMGILGIASAIIDNVPLVAGAMGMFRFPMDHEAWHLLAYTAGTGGSILIIGSAAGVVAMGMEKISFTWYLKRIAPIALLGYLVGYAFMLITL